MKFRAHDTFFLRKGWIYKGMKNVKANSSLFRSKDVNPMDVLGIGSNMVKALRYWLQALGLTYETTSGVREQYFTELGEVIFENDPYIEEVGTLWLLHYKLATNKALATSWYFFFNEFKLKEFNRDDFNVQISNYIRMEDQEVSERSLDDDFNCIVSTYLPRKKVNPKKIEPENNIDCPLGELSLIDISDRKQKIYKKTSPHVDSIPLLIVLSVILEQADNKKEIHISSLLNDYNNVGKIFNLDLIALLQLLTKIELLGYIKVVRTAGLDVVKITTEYNFLDCVRKYYEEISSL